MENMYGDKVCSYRVCANLFLRIFRRKGALAKFILVSGVLFAAGFINYKFGLSYSGTNTRRSLESQVIDEIPYTSKRNHLTVSIGIASSSSVLHLKGPTGPGMAKDRLALPTIESGPVCVLPMLPVWNTVVKKHYDKGGLLLCNKSEENWIFVSHGLIRISSRVLRKHGNVTCTLQVVLRKKDSSVKLGPSTSFTSGTPVPADYFVVHCKAHGRQASEYKNVHFAIKRSQSQLGPRNVPLPSSALGLNVIILGIDSVSRLAWMRSMPRTHKYFTETLNATVLQHHNIVGANSLPNLLALMTGKLVEELPDSTRGKPKASRMNVHPFVWKEFQTLGYVTHYGEDDPEVATFHYNVKGFAQKPVDHYTRPFYLKYESFHKSHRRFCYGSKARHTVPMEWIKELFRVYPDKPKFSFQFLTELTHKGARYLHNVDDDLLAWLKEMKMEGYLNNTMLILMSDHGDRYSYFRKTLQGRYEEHLPYFAMYLPLWFRQKYPQKYHNVRMNANGLTTHFDIHATFLDAIDDKRKGSSGGRSRSLFSRIPRNRTCSDAGVKAHFCTCLNWVGVSVHDKGVQSAADHLVSVINHVTRNKRSKCSVLAMKRIRSAYMYRPSESFVADRVKLSEHKLYFMVTVETVPGHGLYEATLERQKDNTFLLDHNRISRINAYGDQPHCIMREIPILRPYCYCKIQLPQNDQA